VTAASGGGSDLVIAFAWTRGPSPPARGGRLFRLRVVDGQAGRPVGTDRRRQDVEREAVVVAVGALSRPIHIFVAVVIPAAIVARMLARLASFTRLAGTVSLTAVLPLGPLLALLALLALFAIGGFAVGFDQIVLTLVLVGPVAALAPLVLEARAAFAEHTEIMVCILQIIFGLDPVARELRVARQTLVFFEQLGGIPALPVVLAIARLSAATAAEVLAPLSTAAAPAATLLSIVDQMRFPNKAEVLPLWPQADRVGTIRTGS
jgi:hypothetical protein